MSREVEAVLPLWAHVNTWAQIIPISRAKRGVNDWALTALERPFNSADLLWAFVCNCSELMKRDGVPVEACLRLDMRIPAVYTMFLDFIFTTIDRRILKPFQLKAIESSHSNRSITIEAPAWTQYISTITLEVKTAENGDIITDIVVYIRKAGGEVLLGRISQWEIHWEYPEHL